MNCFSRLPLSLLIAFSAAVLGLAETSEPPSVSSEPWPLENVELQSSPQITWGRLENGLRYAIMPHASPPGRISMRLLVTAGSLNENDDERGYAHFVEHMAFNGTKHFPAGELVKFLQREGAVFGADVNATTSYTNTLYKLELPHPADLETGLQIFRDFADGILFAPSEVKRERGVILSEERSQHTPDIERSNSFTDFLYADTLIPARHPIGLVAQIERADTASLRKFYDAWYRPENMCLVVVGELDRAGAEKMIREQFASLAGRGPERPKPESGRLKSISVPEVTTHVREVNGFTLNLVKPFRRPILPHTWGSELQGQRLFSAMEMLGRRLEVLSKGEQRIMNDTGVDVALDYGKFVHLLVKVSSTPQDWEKALAVADQEIRRALAHGFSPEELHYQQARLRERARASAQSFATFTSADIAQAICDALEGSYPLPMSNETLEQTLSVIDQLTVEGCQSAFHTYWGENAPHIFITTAAAFAPEPDKVRAVYAASQTVAVEAGKAEAGVVFGYDDFGPPGVITEKKYIADLDLWTVRFANNVRLNLKATPFEKGIVRFNLRIGNGTLSEPAAKPGLHFWVGAWWLGGVGKHSATELTRLIDGVDSITTGAEDDTFIASGNARSENLPRALRELTAVLTDPAFRPEGFTEMGARLHGMLDPLWDVPNGPVQRFMLPALAGNNIRLGIPDPSAIYARTPEELHSWLAPQLKSGALEFALAGDFDVDQAIAEVAKTFGTLAPREPKPALERERTLQFPQKPVYTYYFYSGPADRPSTLEFFWPIRDALKSSDRRRLPILALILSDRITEQVREKKGATYSPIVQFFANTAYPGFAGIWCTLEVKPDEALKYGQVVRDLAGKLARTGVTSDELVRAKAQFVAAMKSWKNDNGFWMSAVLNEAQEHPEKLDEERAAENDIGETSLMDLNALARKYLGADQIFRYVIEPTARMPKKK